jgi:hypothetical protein
MCQITLLQDVICLEPLLQMAVYKLYFQQQGSDADSVGHFARVPFFFFWQGDRQNNRRFVRL